MDNETLDRLCLVMLEAGKVVLLAQTRRGEVEPGEDELHRTAQQAWEEMDEDDRADARQFVETIAKAAFAEAAKVVEAVELPSNYQWSASNRAKFKFGALRAAAQLRGLEYPCPGHEARDDDKDRCRHCGTHVREYATEGD